MSKPSKYQSLHSVLLEMTSGRSALHMQDEDGAWIDEAYATVAHSNEHFAQASNTLRFVMQRYDELLAQAYVRLMRKQYEELEEVIIAMKNLLI